jgi:hypothetical protein
MRLSSDFLENILFAIFPPCEEATTLSAVKHYAFAMKINGRLQQLVENWKSQGMPKQESFDWSKSKKRWIQTFPESEYFVASLPSQLGREQVSHIFSNSQTSPEEKFLSSMIWGYGDVGYGPFRVRKILDNVRIETVLRESLELCRQELPLESYSYMKDNRIPGLGPAFGTKWLYFASLGYQEMPIYDSLVAQWMSKNYHDFDFSHRSLSSELWNLKTYSLYFSFVKFHAEYLKISPGEVELVIFNDAFMNSRPQNSTA